MHAAAIAHPNIALIKYWGKRDVRLNLPAVPSLSVTLAPYVTRTDVTWGAPVDRFVIDGTPATSDAARRIGEFLDHIDPARPPVTVESANNFPTAAGLASSSSAFAALAIAATAAAGKSPSSNELSCLARYGSGSACRSIWGGWVVWPTGKRPDGTDCHGHPIAPPDHWDIRVLVALVSDAKKPIGSRSAMIRTQQTSPLYTGWVDSAPEDLTEAEAAVAARDLARLGAVMERSTMKMHGTMLSADPPIRYLKPKTLAVLDTVERLRARGLDAWATMDAGPNVKVLCSAEDGAAVEQAITQVGIPVTTLHVGGDARLIE